MEEALHPDIFEVLGEDELGGGDGSSVHRYLGIMSTHVAGSDTVRSMSRV